MSQSSSGAPGWQLEGNAPLAYATHIVGVFLQDYSSRLVEVAAIKPGDRVLDVVSGTVVGCCIVLNQTWSPVPVVAFDSNASMCTRVRASREPAARIEYRLPITTAMPSPDSTFQSAISTNSLQFI